MNDDDAEEELQPQLVLSVRNSCTVCRAVDARKANK